MRALMLFAVPLLLAVWMNMASTAVEIANSASPAGETVMLASIASK